MSIEVQAVQRIRAYSEVAFANDYSGSLGSFTDLPIREGSATLELTTAELDPQTIVQEIDQYREMVFGPRSAKLTFTMNLSATGTAAASATPAITSALGLLLKASMGTETLGTGTTFTGGTAAVPTVTSAAGFAVGTPIGWVNTSGLLEVREIKSISGLSITLKYAFSGAPSAANVAYSAACYTLAQNPAETIQMLVSGAESDDRWLLMGGQMTSMSITLDPTAKALPSIQFTYEFAKYLESDETSSTVTGAIGTATYSAYQPIVGHVGEIRVATNGTTTYSASDARIASAMAFSPKIGFDRVTSPSGTNTVYGWRRKRVAPACEGSWTEPYQVNTWWQDRDASNDHAVWIQLGVTAGSTVFLSAPTVQILNPQRVADASGLAASTMTWKARCDADQALTTDAARSAFRISFV